MFTSDIEFTLVTLIVKRIKKTPKSWYNHYFLLTEDRAMGNVALYNMRGSKYLQAYPSICMFVHTYHISAEHKFK